ncbi:MAG TPA: M20/M25/M40 family metallo-hydrolase, partial [Sphingomicrobium sp.]
MMPQRAWLPGLVFALLLLGFAVKGLLLTPPSPPVTAAAGEFDTDRALARLARILGDQRPHPVDSDANDAVRDRLIAELRAIGLSPRIQEATDCSVMPKSRVVSCSRVRNVIATVGGGAGRHVLLNAHYDGTPAGPGAADDGVGVAALIEIAAVLRASPPARPVSFLFNEGEEFGLNGASAFVREDRLSDDVDSLVNIEARGVKGPALMFETSNPNGPAVSAFAEASRRPYANSLSMDFAKLIPNTTDVVEFRPAGWAILNYAIIGNETRYHTPGDTIAALDQSSLYHVGSETLAATRAMASRKQPETAKTYVFTDIAGRFLLRVPLPIAGVAFFLLLMLSLVQAIRRKATGSAFLHAPGMVVAGVMAAASIAIVAGLVRPGDYWRAYPLIAYLAVYATMLLAMLAVWRRWGSVSDPWRARAAVWLFILTVGGATGIFLPG